MLSLFNYNHFISSRFLGFLPFLLSLVLCILNGCQVTPTPLAAETTALPTQSVAPLVGIKPKAAPPECNEEILRLQIFLDNQNFAPGVIDGKNGSFTEKAKQAYEAIYGPIVADINSHSIYYALYTSYKIREEDLARIGKMASTPKEIAVQKNTPYTELIAFIAERYHTSRAFLEAINPGVNFSLLQAGDSVQVPNISRPFCLEDYYPATKTLPDPMLKQRSVQVDTTSRLLKVLDAGRPIAVFPITPGSKELPAPVGSWIIQGIVAMPWYRYDKGVLQHGVRTTHFYMYPPGPRSPVGILFAGLNKPGIGIHGTNRPETIGRSASHGCIRLSNWDAARFRELVTVGNPVIIQ